MFVCRVHTVLIRCSFAAGKKINGREPKTTLFSLQIRKNNVILMNHILYQKLIFHLLRSCQKYYGRSHRVNQSELAFFSKIQMRFAKLDYTLCYMCKQKAVNSYFLIIRIISHLNRISWAKIPYRCLPDKDTPTHDVNMTLTHQYTVSIWNLLPYNL